MAVTSTYFTLVGIVASSIMARSSLILTRIRVSFSTGTNVVVIICMYVLDTDTYTCKVVRHRNSIHPTFARQHNISYCVELYLASKVCCVLVVHGTISKKSEENVEED